MYAVVKLQGHQYIVNKWDTIVVDKLEWKAGDKIDIEDLWNVLNDNEEENGINN